MRDEKRKIERIIAKAGLTKEEAKVARVYYGSESAGQKTKFWVNNLSTKKHEQLMLSAQKKVESLLFGQRG